MAAASPRRAWPPDARPSWAGPAVVLGGQLVVHLPERQVTAAAPADFLRWLAARCTGTRTLAELTDAAAPRWPRAAVRTLLHELLRNGALVDARRWIYSAWQRTQHPWQVVPAPSVEASAQFAAGRRAPRTDIESGQMPAASPLAALLAARTSCRCFSGRPVATQALIDLLHACYGSLAATATGKLRRTVPAGGGLYGLNAYLIVRRADDALAPGIHRVLDGADGSVVLRPLHGRLADVPMAFDDYKTVRTAPAIIALCGDFTVAGFKYGEKALSYTVLEAGHAAQNALLIAQQLGLGAVEVGGFAPAALSRLLELSPDVVPIITIAIGHPAAQQPPPSMLQTHWVTVDSRIRLRQQVVHARGPHEINAWGRDADPEVAYDKAIVECWERMACHAAVDPPPGRLADWDRAIDPRQLIAFSERQHATQGFRFRRFDPRRRYRWVPCVSAEGEDSVCVAETVYVNVALPRPYAKSPLCAATSSGVAAGFDRTFARTRALLEVIERDAFMFWWMRSEAPPALRVADAARAAKSLALLGIEVRFLDLTVDLLPVVGVWAQSVDGHYTALAAACDFDAEAAARHALQEVESQLYLLEAGFRSEGVAPRQVRSTLHHAGIYADRRYFRKADWFVERARTKRFAERRRQDIANFEQLVNLLAAQGRPVYFHDFAIPDEADERLAVARAIVPGLLPLTFGYFTEPWGITRTLFDGARAIESLSFSPRRPYFPHPFT
jgi:thiazole/oxazole-forming peptide maturase SagD family component